MVEKLMVLKTQFCVRESPAKCLRKIYLRRLSCYTPVLYIFSYLLLCHIRDFVFLGDILEVTTSFLDYCNSLLSKETPTHLSRSWLCFVIILTLFEFLIPIQVSMYFKAGAHGVSWHFTMLIMQCFFLFH